MTHSPEQLVFFSELTSGQSSISLRACAGAGKTSTIVHSATLLPPHVLTVFLAFNKRIADELTTRLPAAVQTGTFHSRCFRALGRSLPKHPKVDADKIRKLLKANLNWNDFSAYSQFVCKLVSLAKSSGLGTSLSELSPENFRQLITHHGLTLDSPDLDESRALDLADLALRESNSDLKSIDFDDMLYLALLRKVTFDKASFIFVDEAQDTNGVQRELLKMMGNFQPQEAGWSCCICGKQTDAFHTECPHCGGDDCGETPMRREYNPSPSRLITVGDPHQAIYGFRGADASAMERMEEEFSMKKMYLSVSWRCSKTVVKEAQKGIQ